MTFNHSFGPLTSATAVTAAFPSSVIGKTIIITGVSPDSLGLATALAFASQKPKQLILTGRSEDNVQSSIKSLRSEYPNVQYHALIMDLASQASVRTAAAKVNDDDGISAIDILVNNAGVMAIPRLTLSEDGIETTPTRIINVSSYGHQFSPIRFSDINFEKLASQLPEDERPDLQKTEFFTGRDWSKDAYGGFISYAQSETANILFSIALTRKLGAKYGVSSFAVHPGAVSTNINRHASPQDIEQALKRVEELGIDSSQKTPDQGANSTVLAAVDPTLAPADTTETHVPGVYMADCKLDNGTCAAFARNRESADRLWVLSEGVVKQNFKF